MHIWFWGVPGLIICAKLLYTATSFPSDALFRSDFYFIRFFSVASCVRLISFIISFVSAKMIRWKMCRIKLHRRSRKEIPISPQVWFQAVNGLCLAEFKQWLPGQMGDKLSPIFRSLRLTPRHSTRGEGISYEKDGDARRNFWNWPLKEPNPSVAHAIFDP